jgi:hypothetical protein
MENLIIAAYRLELFLWVPLLVVRFTTRAGRGWLVAALVMSVVTGAWEIFVRAVSGPDVIRIDIFLALMLAGVVDVACGLALVAARHEAGVAGARFAGVLCLAVAVLAIVGLASAVYETSQSEARLYQGLRLRFEAGFRDDATQKRVFGDLDPASNSWAGYYVGGNEDARVKHLVIDDTGRFWLYAEKFFETRGRGTQATPETFEGGSIGRAADMRLGLRHQGGERYAATVRFGNGPWATVPMSKTSPPRFPQPVAPGGDEVRFLGVFSARYNETEDEVWIVQVWLWQSHNELWGRYLRDYFKRGSTREFIMAEEIHPRCAAQCEVATFMSGRGPVTLKRTSPDSWSAKLDGVAQEVALRSGEIVPGFLFDLAPTTTVKANREWLKAYEQASPMISWDVPGAPAAPARSH